MKKLPANDFMTLKDGSIRRGSAWRHPAAWHLMQVRKSAARS